MRCAPFWGKASQYRDLASRISRCRAAALGGEPVRTGSQGRRHEAADQRRVALVDELVRWQTDRTNVCGERHG